MKNIRKITFHITTVKNRYNLHPTLKASLQSCAQQVFPPFSTSNSATEKLSPKIKKARKTFLPKIPRQPPPYVNSNHFQPQTPPKATQA